MRESLIDISNTADVFSTKIAGTLIESHTFYFLSKIFCRQNLYFFRWDSIATYEPRVVILDVVAVSITLKSVFQTKR